MNSEKQPAAQPPEDNERRARVRYVELNGVRYRSRESNRVDARGNLLERVNELYTADGSNKVFLQREVFNPELGLLTEVTRIDYTDGKTAEDKEEYRYRERSAGLAFFRYVRRLAGVKTVEQTEKYGSGNRRPEELERLEYDQAGQPALRRLEELDPEGGHLLKATTEFYENGLKVLEVVEVFNSGDGQLIKRLSTRYEANREVSHEVEDLTAGEDDDSAPPTRSVEPVFTQTAPMSISKAEAATETPAAPDPAVSPAALLAGFIYAKSIEDNRPLPKPPAYFETSGRDESVAREKAEVPTSPPAPGPERPSAVTSVSSIETPPESSPQTPPASGEVGRSRGPETDAVASDPEKRDLDDQGFHDMSEPDAAQPTKQERFSDTVPKPPQDKSQPSQAVDPTSVPAKARPKQQRATRVVLITVAVIALLTAAYYIFGSI